MSEKKSIFVKSINGQNLVFSVDSGMKIEKLKVDVQAKTSIKIEDQRLVYGGKQLEEGLTLEDYGIQENSTIVLAARVRGGL